MDKYEPQMEADAGQDSEVVAAIKEVIEARIRPSVQEDGGDIYFVAFDGASGIVTVRLAGACVGCASSSVTLRNGVENMLMHYIPEVKGIHNEEASDDSMEGSAAAGGSADESTTMPILKHKVTYS